MLWSTPESALEEGKTNMKKQKQTTNGRKQISKQRDIINRLFRSANAVIGLIIILILVFTAIFADVLVDYETMVIKPNVLERLQKPSSAHLLGTDELGRDVLARLIYGARMSLVIGLGATVFSVGTGVILGSIAGYYGGWVDNIIMRICDVFIGIPGFLLAITIAAAFGQSMITLMIALAFGAFGTQTRIMRGAVLTILGQEYVEAGKAMGANAFQIIFYHIIPNCIATIIVQFSLRLAGGVLAASSLSFLGLGIQPPDPEWGAMLSGGRTYLLDSSYLTLFPGLCIMITILAFNMLGDGLRDSLDPRLKR